MDTSEQNDHPTLVPSGEWVGGTFTTPLVIREGPEPYRARMAVWLELPADQIVGHGLVHPDQDPSKVLASVLREALESPLVGAPRRPAALRLPQEEFVPGVREVVGEDMVVRVEDAPEFERLRQSMIEATEAGVIGATDYEGAIEPSYLESGMVSVEEVGEMFRAATVLRAMKPWERLGEENPVRLDIPGLGVHGACVILIGILGESRGLLIFPSLEHFERFNDAARRSPGKLPEDTGTSVRSFTLERGADVPESMRKEVSTHGWVLMDAESYPVLEHRTPQSVPLELTDLDLQIVNATVRSLCTFALHFGDQIQGGNPQPRSESYKEGDGLVVRLTCPYESFEEFDDLPEDAQFEGPSAEEGQLDDERWIEFENLVEDRGMDIDAAYGILTAVASHPSMEVGPSAWLPLLLGPPEFGEDEDPQHIMTLVMDAYNSIVEGLGSASLVIPPWSQQESLREWCQGYMQGMGLNDEWVADDMAREILVPVLSLAGVGQEDEDEAEEFEGLLAGLDFEELEDAVIEAHGYFREMRMSEEASRRTPARREKESVGRNDPCPCGSGKKYKKCCLGE